MKKKEGVRQELEEAAAHPAKRAKRGPDLDEMMLGDATSGNTTSEVAAEPAAGALDGENGSESAIVPPTTSAGLTLKL